MEFQEDLCARSVNSDGSGEVEAQETMHMDDVQKLDRSCYLADMINSGGGCEITVARR